MMVAAVAANALVDYVAAVMMSMELIVWKRCQNVNCVGLCRSDRSCHAIDNVQIFWDTNLFCAKREIKNYNLL